MTKIDISAEVMDAVVSEIRAEVRRRDKEESAIHADVGDEHCRVCGGRDHQCDEQVVERSVKKDNVITSVIHEQSDEIKDLREEIERRKAEFNALNERYAKNCESERHAADCRKHIDVLVKQMTGTEDLFKKACDERDSYKKSYDSLWLSGEKDKQKDNTMAGVNQLRYEVEQLRNRCERINHDWALRYDGEKVAWIETRDKLAKEVEQLRVQLAGCGVAALGGTSQEQLVIKNDYGWSPAYQSTLELRLKYDEITGTVERQRKHLEIKDADIEKLQVENAEHVKARKGQVERIDHLIEKLKNKDDKISILVGQVKKAQSQFVDVVARDDGKEIESLEKELSRQQKAATDLFDECKKLQGERAKLEKDLDMYLKNEAALRKERDDMKAERDDMKAERDDCQAALEGRIGNLELTLQAAVRKLNLGRYAYQSLSELREEIEKLPYMAPVRTSGPVQLVTANGTKLSGAPTWPQYKVKRGPEMPEIDPGQDFKDKQKRGHGLDHEVFKASEALMAEQHDPGKAIQDARDDKEEDNGFANCQRCGKTFKYISDEAPTTCQQCYHDDKKVEVRGE